MQRQETASLIQWSRFRPCGVETISLGLVQGAHHILGPFGVDSDLRRWGLKLAERGGKNGKKRG
jgi:hypothetical protein